MKYKVYQPWLSEIQHESYAAGEASDAREAYLKARMDGDVIDAVFEALYKHVCDIEADDLEEVFEIGNIGPENKITRHDRMSSVSVGDIVVDETGVASVVLPLGFEVFKHGHLL